VFLLSIKHVFATRILRSRRTRQSSGKLNVRKCGRKWEEEKEVVVQFVALSLSLSLVFSFSLHQRQVYKMHCTQNIEHVNYCWAHNSLLYCLQFSPQSTPLTSYLLVILST
jgi:hypothetical protein